MIKPSIKQFFLWLIIGVITYSCSDDSIDSSQDNTPEPLEYAELLNLTYGIDPEQVLDIYLPANRSEDTKTIILVHGGGWTSGDKSDMEAIRLFIQSALPEIALVNINYRLANENAPPYPMQIDDISLAVDFLESQSKDYVISETLGFVGVSAGAHLSLLWSYAFDEDQDVAMACSIVGPVNFTDPAYLESEDGNIQAYLELFGIDPTISYLETISPFHQVTTISPPTILFYGGQDPLVPISQGIDMAEKLESLDVPFEFTLYENAGHGWTGTELLDTSNKLIAFIENYLLEN